MAITNRGTNNRGEAVTIKSFSTGSTNSQTFINNLYHCFGNKLYNIQNLPVIRSDILRCFNGYTFSEDALCCVINDLYNSGCINSVRKTYTRDIFVNPHGDMYGAIKLKRLKDIEIELLSMKNKNGFDLEKLNAFIHRIYKMGLKGELPEDKEKIDTYLYEKRG